jgi:DNA-binding transcriptional LysR family regulator
MSGWCFMTKTDVDYRLLANFVAVADQQSFTKAARRQGIGKGTVSRAIAQLEALLGAELIHRTTHAVALSTAGLALYERVAPHLAALDQAVQKLPERGSVPSGQLRITAPPDVGLIVLPEVLSHFSRRYPEISFELHLTNVQVNLVADGFDLALRAGSGALKDSTLTARRLCETAISFFAAPSYLARRGKPKKLGDTAHDWIVHTSVRAVNKPLREVTARFLCDDFLLIRNLARDGGGIAILPRFVGSPFVVDGLLEEVPLGDRPGGSPVLYLVYPSSGQVPRKVTAFRDFFVEWLKTSPLQ